MKKDSIEIVEKPWGREIIIAHETEYIGKIIEVEKEAQLSYQYHEDKKETLYVLSGRMKIIMETEEIVFKEGEAVTLYPGDKHRIEAIDALRIIEVSTSHMEDVVRLKDEYGRV